MDDDEYDDDKPEYKVTSTYIVAGPDTMRQPTNLELAQFITLQSALQTSLIFLELVDRDVMSDQEDYGPVAHAVEASSQAVTRWWLNLMLDMPDEFKGHG